jgi:hypothetical protein
MGDFSEATLAVYRSFLEESGLGEVQRESRHAWSEELRRSDVRLEVPDRLFHLTRRWLEDFGTEDKEYSHSLWGEAYYNLIKPLAPWYARLPLGLAAWADTLGWRRLQARLRASNGPRHRE